MPLEDGSPTPEEITATAEAEATVKASAAAPPEFVAKADYDKLAEHVGKLTTTLEDAGKRLAIVDKVANLLAGKPESALSAQEQAVVTELKRLMPHILPHADFLDHAPKLLETVAEASKAASETLVSAAFDYQLRLQADAGLKVDDPKANFYIGTAIKEWINQDGTRRARFWRGDHSVVKEGFDEIKAVVIDPLRRGDKSKVVSITRTRPVNAGPGSPGGSGGAGETTVDFRDRKAVRAALSAALATP